MDLKQFFTPLGYAQYSVDASTAKGLASDAPSVGTSYTAAKAATGGNRILLVEVVPDGAIRYRLDGADPTSAIGNALPAGAQYIMDTDPTKFRFISQSGTVLVSVEYKGEA